MRMIYEYEIREALLRYLEKHAPSTDARIIEELGLEHGASRIDVAVVSDRLVGYEIKSDYDNLLRLPNQIHAYNRIFDEITIVSGSEFITELGRVIPSWWGIIQANISPRYVVTLETIRKAQPNEIQSELSIASLLWKEEAAELLAKHLAKKPPVSWDKAKLYARLSELSNKTEIRDWVAQKLKSRTVWRNSSQSVPNDGLSHLVATS